MSQKGSIMGRYKPLISMAAIVASAIMSQLACSQSSIGANLDEEEIRGDADQQAIDGGTGDGFMSDEVFVSKAVISRAMVHSETNRICIAASSRSDYWSDAWKGGVAVVDLNNWNISPVVAGDGFYADPAFSPGGDEFAFAGGSGIYVYRMETGELRTLRGSTASDSGPSFSPDGKDIIFRRSGLYRPYSLGGGDTKVSTEWDAFKFEGQTKRIFRLTNQRFYGMSPPYYVEENTIIFAAQALGDFRGDVYLCRLERTGATLTPLSLEYELLWGAAGAKRSITFTAVLNPSGIYNYDLFKVDPRGEEVTRLTNMQSGGVADPVFATDGKHVTCRRGLEVLSINMEGEIKRIVSEDQMKEILSAIRKKAKESVGKR